MNDKSTSQLSDIEAVILGLLCEKSRYGYELEKIINQRAFRMWTNIGFSSIYYVLKRLKKNGLVITEEKKGEKGKPSRRIYSCTDNGRHLMQNKVTEILSTFQKVTSPMDLAVAFVGLISKEKEIECLKMCLDSINKRTAFLKEKIRSFRSRGFTFHMTSHFVRHLYTAEAEKKWVKQYLKYLLNGGENIERHWVDLPGDVKRQSF